jgi:hypothetical protein
MLHRVVARFGLRLRGCPIPPFEVSKILLDVAARKLGDDVLTNVCGSILPIFAKKRLQFDGVADTPPFGTGGRCGEASLYERLAATSLPRSSHSTAVSSDPPLRIYPSGFQRVA